MGRIERRRIRVEARALYAGHGYAEVAPFNAAPYAEYWFEKRLWGSLDSHITHVRCLT